MQKYLSIAEFSENGKTGAYQVIAMPDNLKINCRLCSDGPLIVVTNMDTENMYFLSIDVNPNLHQMCYDAEESDCAESLERGLLKNFMTKLDEFIASDEVILNTDDLCDLYSKISNRYLGEVQEQLAAGKLKMTYKRWERNKKKRSKKSHNKN